MMFAISALATLVLGSSAHAAIETLQPSSDAHAAFEAVGKPGIIRIKGQGAKVQGQLTLDNATAKANFEIDLNEFSTGISMRDKHMKEKYLDTAAFPKAQLAIESVDLPAGFQPGQDVGDAKFKGKLTIKGVTKPVEGHVKITGPKLATEAQFDFSLNDYPVGVPSYMGITVADQVHVQVDVPAFEIKK